MQERAAQHKIVIGLSPFGTVLWNRTLRYCHETGQPTDPEKTRNIFHQAVCQSFGKLEPDFRNFGYSILEIPSWTTMNYTDGHPGEPGFKAYADEVRAFALSLWHHMNQRGYLKHGRHYYVESTQELLAVVAFYDDAAYL